MAYKCVKRQVQAFTLVPELFRTLKLCQMPIVNGKKIPVPALLVEVHSSPFRDSMRKCSLGMIEQLCLYRTANPNISSCIGFTFPKLPSAGTENLQSVIQVTVTWESFRFCYELQSLELEEVPAALKAAVAKNTFQMHKYPLEQPGPTVVRVGQSTIIDDLKICFSSARMTPS